MMTKAELAAVFPLLAELVKNFVDGNDACANDDLDVQTRLLTGELLVRGAEWEGEASVEDLAEEAKSLDLPGAEAELRGMEEFHRGVIVFGILPAECSWYEGPDEMELAEANPKVDAVLQFLMDANGGMKYNVGPLE